MNTVLQSISNATEKHQRFAIAIDGRSAAGKSTLASQLEERVVPKPLVVHMVEGWVHSKQTS